DCRVVREGRHRLSSRRSIAGRRRLCWIAAGPLIASGTADRIRTRTPARTRTPPLMTVDGSRGPALAPSRIVGDGEFQWEDGDDEEGDGFADGAGAGDRAGGVRCRPDAGGRAAGCGRGGRAAA